MTANEKSTGKKIGYIRVSSVDQNDARQLDGLEFDKVFVDKASGKDTQRLQLQAMLEYMRDGDQLYVHSMDRLSRSLKDLQEIVEILTNKGIKISFLKEGLIFEKLGSTTDAHKVAYSMLMMQLLGAVSQFERTLIRERQREGIAIAKRKGLYKGRKSLLNEALMVKLREMTANGMSKTEIAKSLSISRATVYKYLNSV